MIGEVSVGKLLPVWMKKCIKVVIAEAVDVMDVITGKRGAHLPPTRLLFDGSPTLKDYLQGGEDFMRAFRLLMKPKPSWRILDIGSGVGRHTLPLTKFLNSKGSYEGFEIVKAGVEWCDKHITTRFPRFRFTLVDLYNGSYNPKGKILPKDFVFPYENDSFDAVMALSVFTHMKPEDVSHYLKEVERVLKPGGKSLLTFFLINKESRVLLDNPDNSQRFVDTGDGYWTTHLDLPELAIGYDEKIVRRFYREAGLEIERIAYGSWCGRKKFNDYQDEIIARKNR